MWLESRLRRLLGGGVAGRYTALVQKKAEKVFLSTREVQKTKLADLVEDRKCAEAEEQKRWQEKNVGKRTSISREGWVVNLSSFDLSDVEVDVLRKGLNFAPAPRNVPTFDIVTSIENALRQKKGIAEGAAEVARAKVAGIVNRFQREIRRTGREQKNLSKEEKEAFEKIKKKKDVIVVPADKGNATVVMNAKDYKTKALDLIGKRPFEEVSRCPKQKVEDRINGFLWDLFQQKVIKKTLYNQLHASACPLPRFYGLAKIHKDGVPLRPVISAVGSALYAVSKYLASVLKPLVGKTQFTVANSKDFVSYIAGESISSDEVMVSFDVKALYTSLPVKRTLEAVSVRLKEDKTLAARTPFSPEHLMVLLEICLTSTYFVFQEKYYRLSDGVAMGSPVSSVVANLFMERLEKDALSSSGALRPRVWKRYVDDVFSILRRANVKDFLKYLNSIDDNIEFTVEEESNCRLPFLDASVTRMETGSLQTSVFRKETHTDRVLNFNSSHSSNAKSAVVRALIGRIETHFADGDVNGRDLETAHVQEVLTANDYPERFVERVVRRMKQQVTSDPGSVSNGQGSSDAGSMSNEQASSDSGSVSNGQTFSDAGSVSNEEVCSNSGSVTSHREVATVSTWVSVPYVRGMSEAIGKTLRPLGIGVAHRASPWKWTLCAGLKDSIPEKSRKGVIYRVPCKECDAVYIGETLRNLEERLKEHKRHVEKSDPKGSAIAEHVLKTGHSIAWDKAQVIDYEQRWGARKIKESLHIKRERANRQLMNRDGGLAISRVWQHVI